MRRTLWIGVLAGFALCTLSPAIQAADHRDGHAVLADPSTDINDVYTWMNADKSKVYLAMTVFPVADRMSKFSTAAKYVFHLTSGATYGATTTQTVNIICTFDASQKASCWAVNGTNTLDYVTGDASPAAGIPSASGKMKVFAGLRSDPFFFNLDGFKATADAVAAAAGGLMTDGSGCPTNLPAATAMALVTQLKKAPPAAGSPFPGTGDPVDFFKTLNTLAIVMSVDTAMVSPGGKIVAVWGSTNN